MLSSRVKKVIVLNHSNYFSVLSALRQKSHYDTLGLTPKASQSEIKAAFYRLSKIFHPDTNKDPKAAERFRELASAYEVLSSSTGRQAYDRGQNQHSRTPVRKGFTVPEPEGLNAAFRKSSYNVNHSRGARGDRIYNFKAWTEAHYKEASFETSYRTRIKEQVHERREHMKHPGSGEIYFSAVVLIGLALTGAVVYIDFY